MDEITFTCHFFHGLAETKIADLYLILVQHDIRRLHIPMQNVVLTQQTHSAQDLVKVSQRWLLIEELVFVNLGLQSAPTAKLINHVNVVNGCQFLNILDDVRVINAL